MSRVGKKPIDIPPGVKVLVNGSQVTVQGPLGALSMELPRGITATLTGGKVLVQRENDEVAVRSCHGLGRTLVANMIEGVSKGFQKELEIHGVGFKATLQGRKLILNLGRSHPVNYEVPEGVTVTVEAATALTVKGMDKQKVGNVAARIRAFCPVEPYKGKGIQYKGERVRRKVGKTVA